MSIRVLLADDEQLVRAGLRMILDAEEDIEIVGEVCDGEEAVEFADRHRVDVLLMDIRMPRLDGVKATRRLLAAARLPPLRVIVLTTYDLDEYVYGALRAGASGFLLKDAPPEQLVIAIRVAAAGEALLAPRVTRRLIEKFARAAPRESEQTRLAQLSPRERQVLSLVARGLTNAEIAADLVLSEATVKTHVSNLLGKLGLRDRTQAVVLAYESGLVEPGATGPESHTPA